MSTHDEILRAAELIRAGKLVAFPTETVYGLGANAMDHAAVDRIFAVKRRPFTSPLIVHVCSEEMAHQVAAAWPKEAAVLTHRFWPGPLTLILPKQPAVPERVTAGLPSVGVRMPAHPVALELIRSAGVPIAAPSANRFTQLSPTTAAHVRAGLGDEIDLILDGGPTQVGIESTVLSLTGEPLLLRPGMVSQTEIEALTGPVQLVSLPSEGAHRAPGLHPRHYSPGTPLSVGGPLKNRAVWLYWKDQTSAQDAVRMPADPAGYARRLYDVLHELDSQGWDQIIVEPVPDTPEWAGIRDRLQRASRNNG